MPQLLTFGELKASPDGDDLASIAGVCKTGDAFRGYVSKSVRMLMTRGDFWATVEKVSVCIYNQCVVWPRYVGTVLALNFRNHPTRLQNQWYEFMPLSRMDFCGEHSGPSFCGSHGNYRGNMVVEEDGTSPVFNPIPCNQSFYIRVYPSTQQDVGKQVTIFGVDDNGLAIRTQIGNTGVWQDGVTLTMAIPFVSTPFKLREVTRITKDATQGVVRYYQYDADQDLLMDLVWHDPSELTPVYRKSRIPLQHQCKCQTACNGLHQVSALVKLEFQAVNTDQDLVLISNKDALRDMIQAIRFKDSGDTKEGTNYELLAIHELNLELTDRYPKDQTPVTINPFGSAMPQFHGIGRII